MTFVILIAIEAVLVYVARRRGTRAGDLARRAVYGVPLVFIFALRAYQAIATPGILDWDESYYLSNAVTAAGGHGLYPYFVGYRPMPVLPGVGYVAYVNALAVILAGPTLTALRIISLLASLIGLLGMWRLVRIWYGSGAAWAATTLTAASSLFLLSNNARTDSWTFAYVTWALVAFAKAFDRWNQGRPHLIAGLVFGLGLQVHPDVIVTALACGLVYVVAWAASAFSSRRWEWPLPPLMFLAGFSAGFALFLLLNVWIDPTAFYRVALVVRVDATGWYSSGTGSITGSFLNPAILLAKEQARYAALSRAVSPVEAIVVALAIAAVYVRRLPADRIVMTLLPAVVIATAVMLNNATAVYFIHVAPALLVPLGPLFTCGIRARAAVSERYVSTWRLAMVALVAAAFCAIYDGRLIRTVTLSPGLDARQRRLVEDVRAVAGRRCKVVGDGGLYVEHFADYPYYISSRPTEVHYAMLSYAMTNELDYWSVKRPDVAFGPLSPALAAYVSANGFSERAPTVWVRRDGCAGGP
jgi:hypothetical protein